MSEKSETPSEAEARAELHRLIGDPMAPPEEERTVIAAYRAAVLREADAETVALVERLRYWLARDPLNGEEALTLRSTALDADAWLAKRGGGK